MMTKEKIILLGGGGHCKSVIDLIESLDNYIIYGIVDIKEKIGGKILDYKIIASDDDIPELVKECENFCIAVGQIKSPDVRIRLYNQLKELGAKLPVIISSDAYVSKYSVIGEGTVVFYKSFINAGAKLGFNNIINTGAIIEHDVIIGNHCHISIGAVLGGECVIKDGCFIGGNAFISNRIIVNKKSMIGGGAVVMSDTVENTILRGNPARSETR